MAAVDAVLAGGGEARLHRFVADVEELESLERTIARLRLQDERVAMVIQAADHHVGKQRHVFGDAAPLRRDGRKARQRKRPDRGRRITRAADAGKESVADDLEGMVDRRIAVELRMHRRQVIALAEILDDQLPVGVDLEAKTSAMS